jgi:heptosyltransferase-2
MRILVFRGGALGDFLVTLPALGLLRTHWPAARIELAGHAAAGELGVLGGYLDGVHSQHEARWSALFREGPLPSKLAAWLAAFDLVLNYWPDSDGTLARRFPLRPGQQFLSAPAQPALAPAARYFCEALRPLGLSTADYRSRLRIPDDTSCHREAGEASRGDPVPTCRGPAGLLRRIAPRNDDRSDAPAPLLEPGSIAIHPGSGSARKNWPTDRWLELIRRLDQPILLVLGEAEQEWLATCRSLLAHSAGSGPRACRGAGDQPALLPATGSPASRLLQPRVQLAHNLSLPELAAALARCRLFLGHDSGVSHLAAALGTPCVLLFGPTDPAMWAPPGDHVRDLRHGATLDTISVDEVLAAVAGNQSPGRC